MVVYIPSCFSNPAYEQVGIMYNLQFIGSKQVF